MHIGVMLRGGWVGSLSIGTGTYSASPMIPWLWLPCCRDTKNNEFE
jgi:hypothetical protein